MFGRKTKPQKKDYSKPPEAFQIMWNEVLKILRETSKAREIVAIKNNAINFYPDGTLELTQAKQSAYNAKSILIDFMRRYTNIRQELIEYYNEHYNEIPSNLNPKIRFPNAQEVIEKNAPWIMKKF